MSARAQSAERRERPEKDARAKADADAGSRAEHRPFERADEQCRMLGVPTSLVGETRRLVAENPAAEPHQPCTNYRRTSPLPSVPEEPMQTITVRS